MAIENSWFTHEKWWFSSSQTVSLPGRVYSVCFIFLLRQGQRMAMEKDGHPGIKLAGLALASGHQLRGVTCKNLSLFLEPWLVGGFSPYPSEKSWSESQLGWLFHSQVNGKS